MTGSKVEIALLPASALRLLKAYGNSEYPCCQTRIPVEAETCCVLQLVQDGSTEDIRLELFADGTWNLPRRPLSRAKSDVPGGAGVRAVARRG